MLTHIPTPYKTVNCQLKKIGLKKLTISSGEGRGARGKWGKQKIFQNDSKKKSTNTCIYQKKVVTLQRNKEKREDPSTEANLPPKQGDKRGSDTTKNKPKASMKRAGGKP